MPGFLSPRKGVPLLLIPEYSGINKGQRVSDRSKTAHRKPLVKCILTPNDPTYRIFTVVLVKFQHRRKVDVKFGQLARGLYRTLLSFLPACLHFFFLPFFLSTFLNSCLKSFHPYGSDLSRICLSYASKGRSRVCSETFMGQCGCVHPALGQTYPVRVTVAKPFLLVLSRLVAGSRFLPSSGLWHSETVIELVFCYSQYLLK